MWGKGSGVSSLLRLCGGRSYENSHLPYLSYISGITFSYAQRIQLFERKKSKGEITEEEAKKHEEWVDETGKKLQNLHNPYIFDVIHSLESLMWTGSYESAKRILSNPPYGNRIIETIREIWGDTPENNEDMRNALQVSLEGRTNASGNIDVEGSGNFAHQSHEVLTGTAYAQLYTSDELVEFCNTFNQDVQEERKKNKRGAWKIRIIEDEQQNS
jgi:hypothetical protein